MSIDSTGAVPPSAPAPQSNPASVPPVGAPQAFATAAAQPAAAPAEAVHFLDYWQILYSRKEIVIAVAILLILVGIVITRQMPKVFAATTIIEVQRETPNIDLFGHGMPRYDPIYLRTQFEIIKSYPILEQVVKESNLDEDLGMEYGWKNNYSKQSVREKTIDLLKRRTTLSIFRDTDLIAIQVRLDKPVKPEGEAARVAARVANSIAKVYQDNVKAESRKPIIDGLAHLEGDIKTLERQISEGEDKLAEMRARHGISVMSQSDTGVENIRSRIAELTARAGDARTEAAVKKSRYDRLAGLDMEEALAVVPVVTSDGSLAALQTQRRELETRMAAQDTAGLGANHPDVIVARTAYEECNRQISVRLEEIRTALKHAWEQAQQEADLRAAELEDLANQERVMSSGVAIDMEKLTQKLAADKQRKRDLESRRDAERIKLEMPKTAVIVREEARVPETPLPVSPNFALNVTLSIVAGLFFGVVLAFFVEYLDTTIKSAEDIERYLQANVLGVVPQKLRALNDPNARFSHYEIYRVLRMNLKNSRALAGGKAILFTSASAGEGKSLNAFNVAWVCAESGEKTLLIDADLFHPRQHRTLGAALSPGFSNVIVGEATLEGAIVKTAQPSLDFLPAGRIAGASVFGLMDTEESLKLFETLRSRYDRIVVDAPPMIGVSDTAQLVRLCDGVVLVVQHRKYPRALCRRAKERVIAMGGNFLGVLLNNVNASNGSSSYYYENQYYYYYTGDSEGHSRRRRRRSRSHHGDGESSSSSAPSSKE